MTAASSLLSALRWDKDGEEVLQNLRPDEWNTLFNLLKEKGGQQFLALRLRQTNISAPDLINSQLRLHILGNAARNFAGKQLLFKAIASSGRQAILLKGIDLAGRVYSNLGLRSMGDIDILAQKKDIPAFAEYFTQIGYTCSPTFDEGLFDVDDYHNLTFTKSDASTLPIELHWRLTDEHDIDLDGIWLRSLAIDAQHKNARVMSSEDLLVYLCLHMEHHYFDVSLTQLWDLAELITDSDTKIDWDIVRARAEEWGATDSINICLHLLTRNLGVTTTQFSSWKPDADLSAIMPCLLDNLGLFPDISKFAGPKLLSLLSSSSSMQERSYALFKGLFPAKAVLRATFNKQENNIILDNFLYLRFWTRLFFIKCRAFRKMKIDYRELHHQGERQLALIRYIREKREQADGLSDT
ncbi:nucleotidyltransferase domain-containing protein [Thalassospira lucentensis]|uniref:nucleotidyltransferase domain-containing protein n=1 Tax=Thalassospira lucentensis TaxID=168935 RepID=UPI00142E5967|nr:nucleotidyltransferase family protein [Thalassospira lucentensis]NIZ01949.1 nucleotidyltransferase family protein [Thalassospira lucentensis]